MITRLYEVVNQHVQWRAQAGDSVHVCVCLCSQWLILSSVIPNLISSPTSRVPAPDLSLSLQTQFSFRLVVVFSVWVTASRRRMNKAAARQKGGGGGLQWNAAWGEAGREDGSAGQNRDSGGVKTEMKGVEIQGRLVVCHWIYHS